MNDDEVDTVKILNKSLHLLLLNWQHLVREILDDDIKACVEFVTGAPVRRRILGGKRPIRGNP
jgi:hypothetical protein